MDERSKAILARLQKEVEDDERAMANAPRMPPKPPIAQTKPRSGGSGVKNIYEIMPKDLLDTPKNPHFNVHNIKLPFRMAIVAPSGSGKSNLLCNIIAMFSAKPEGTFHTIHIITKNKNEPLYKFLESMHDDIKITEGLESVPKLDSFDKDLSHLICFDDLVLEKNQQKICNYYIRCRKLNASVCYLSQSYYQTPKIVRQNCSHLLLLKLGSHREINMVLSEGGLGVDKEDLCNLYQKATSEKLVPFLIDYEEEPEKRYRKGFTEVLSPPTKLSQERPS